MESLSTDYMATWKYQQSQKNDKKGIELKVMDGVNMIYHYYDAIAGICEDTPYCWHGRCGCVKLGSQDLY